MLSHRLIDEEVLIIKAENVQMRDYLLYSICWYSFPPPPEINWRKNENGKLIQSSRYKCKVVSSRYTSEAKCMIFSIWDAKYFRFRTLTVSDSLG